MRRRTDRPYVSCLAPMATPRAAEPSPPRVREIRADRLTAEQKRVVWAHIQANEPELHEFLTDPVIAAFRKRQGDAVPVFELAMVEKALGGPFRA